MLRNKRAGAGWSGLVLGLFLAGLASSASLGQGPQPATSAAGSPAPDQPERPDEPLRRPLESTPPPAEPSALPTAEPLIQTLVDPPLGFSGPSGVRPREVQQTSDFVPVEDRWRVGFPAWDRYNKGHPRLDDYPYVEGHWWDPFNQNVFKGDYPILGQHTFLDVKATSLAVLEERQVPTPTTPFESTTRPNREDFFGSPNQFFYSHYFSLGIDLFHGDTAFKPVDWRVKLTPTFNVNYLAVDELAVVNPDVRRGTTRGRTWFSLEEYFVESKITDLSPDYDFMSVRIGSQPFTSDFRGFIFSDTNRAVRIFGTRLSNKDQFNLLVFDQQEKDTNSDLNTFQSRHQNVYIANYYRQDFIFPGYTTEVSVHYNHDGPTFHFDKNNFLVRPDPVGVFEPHRLDVAYLGWAGDGHIGRYNISHAFYWALGRDSLNPIANQPQDINAQMAAVELSYDRDWVRFRTSFFWASGDSDPNNKHATGFDSILDHPNFAGGDFSYWQRQAIKLFGVNLTNRESLLADLRSSKTEGQSNFVNPGLWLANGGVDFDLTPKLRMINNVNFLWFDETESLRTLIFQNRVRSYIGTDLSTGFEYRPLLSNNIIMTAGLSTLLPGSGFQDLYRRFTDRVNPLLASFMQLELTY
ncbi:MAG TPA: hypothetical protein VKU02_02435 [Gemmataceae bacterium]|nr:hypothetical protein [Gemmataceae bacterium]